MKKLARLRRMRLRRHDGRIYLDRWGFDIANLGGVFLHRMEAPDPGVDLHDHPWAFTSLILWGGYAEERALTRDAPSLASIAERWPTTARRGVVVWRRWLSVKTMRLDECHRITSLDRRTVWTLVVHGPRRRSWGFYLPKGYMGERDYDETVRVERRDLWNEAPKGRELWAGEGAPVAT